MDEEKKKSRVKQEPPATIGHEADFPHADDHEEKDIDIVTALKWTGGLTACVLVCMVVSRLIMIPYLKGDPEDRVGIREYYPPQVLKHFPVPQLQPEEQDDLHKWRAFEDSILNSYGWVDKEKQMVRVPIDRAMDMLLEKGLPTRVGSNE